MKSKREVVGLCLTCRHVRVVKSQRGGVFYLCRLSETDPEFPKYPGLPVLECRGYERGGCAGEEEGE